MAKSELTIFISSPGDVAPERALMRAVIARINESLPEIVLKSYFSEDDVYFASRGPQQGIPLSSQFDLVVCLFWKHMGRAKAALEAAKQAIASNQSPQ